MQDWKQYRQKAGIPTSVERQAFKSDILKLLKGVESSGSISSSGMDVLTDVLIDLLDNVVKEAHTLSLLPDAPKSYLTKNDIQGAYSLILDGQLLKLLKSRCDYIFSTLGEKPSTN